MLQRIVPALALVLLTLALDGASVAIAGQETRRDWPAWRDAVVAHVPGERDDSVARIAEWSRPALEAAGGGIANLNPAERLRFVERALVLHTDIAQFNRTPAGYTLPATDDRISLFADGQEVGHMTATFHWAVARRLIERLPRGDDRTDVARTYYRATSALLQSWGEQTELQAHLAAAARVLGNDAVLLMYEGTWHQVSADPRSQRYFDAQRRAAQSPRLPISPGAGMAQPMARPTDPPPTVEDARQAAERAFRRALAADPTLHEARIRLVHILHDRGRHAEGLAELDRVVAASPLPPFLNYYAATLEGRLTRALNRFDRAQAAFERALSIEPGAQSPRMGLSEVALARGDRDEAARQLGSLATQTTADDPWWRLGRLHAPSAQTLIDAMRSPVP